MAIGELCQNMRIVVVNNATQLVCVTFAGHVLIHLDTVTGKSTRLYTFSALKTPIYYSACVNFHEDGKSSSYFVLLDGSIEYEWIEIDIQSRKIVSSSKILVRNLPGPLALSQFIY